MDELRRQQIEQALAECYQFLDDYEYKLNIESNAPTPDKAKFEPDSRQSSPQPGAELAQLGKTPDLANPQVARQRIFISYKRNSSPDELVANQVYNVLSQNHDVFIDRSIAIGTRWMEQIELELARADFLIVFLSLNSVNSEMVVREIELASQNAQRYGKPFILPVRLNYHEPFQYPLNYYLNSINWALWTGLQDTERLITELNQAISGNNLSFNLANFTYKQPLTPELPHPAPFAQPTDLEKPEGTMRLESKFYLSRHTDDIALETIKSQGVTITVKGPRQMGKSSLLVRIVRAARREAKKTAFLDFQLFDKAVLNDANAFYRQFCVWVSDKLGLEDATEKFWKPNRSLNQRCTNYMEQYILEEVNKPLVLAMDEVETLFDTTFRSDFFGMLRNWHNNRATDELWEQLDLVLVTSTEPYQLIDNLNQSPFNVGEVLELNDFDGTQVAELNRRHNSPLSLPEERELISLLSGHPYLTRRALYLVASGRMTAKELFKDASDDRGPFGDHLRNHLFRLRGKPELIEGLKQAVRGNTRLDDVVFFRLRGAGLIKRENRVDVPRCQLYTRYFNDNLK